ncbi:MAG: NAD(+)/NADH kinase [Chthoniobacteraceae bacterium]
MSAAVIGIIAHIGKAGARRVARALSEEFANRGVQALLEARTAGAMELPGGVPLVELGERCELLVALGGDGTILRIVRDLGEVIPPIFGINLGSLGFLTCLSSADAMLAVGSIAARDYTLSSRQLLHLRLLREGREIASQRALNDVVLSRGAVSRMINIEARVNGRFLTSYHADGLIVATPTGSTAYTLAAGGPILDPDSGAFIITPICPHVLTNRPMIVDDTAEVEILLGPDQHEISLNVDGSELARVHSGDRIVIRKSEQMLKLAMLPGVDFFEVLRQKLKWSGSAL